MPLQGQGVTERGACRHGPLEPVTTRWGGVLALLWLLNGCAVLQGGSTPQAAPERVDPSRLLPQFDARSAMDPDTARLAQPAVRAARDEVALCAVVFKPAK